MLNNKKTEQLYLKYKNHIFNFIFRLANDHELAMDITQQTFLTALSNKHQISLTKFWLITVARTIFYEQLTTRKTISIDNIDQSIELNFIHEPNQQLPLSHALKILQSKIEKTLTKMSTSTKELMILYFIETLSLIEIADITKRSLIAIKVNLHHARVIFETRLIKYMRGKIRCSDDQCPTYSRIISQFHQSDIPDSDLANINEHISNCKNCINSNEQLIRTGILLNLTPLYLAPTILDKIIFNKLNLQIHSENQVRKIY